MGGIRAFDRGRMAASIQALTGFCQTETGCAACDGGYAHGDGQGHIAAPRHGVESFLLRGDSTARYDLSKVNSWLADVLWEGSAGGVYRCKGIFLGPPDVDDDEDAMSAG